MTSNRLSLFIDADIWCSPWLTVWVKWCERIFQDFNRFFRTDAYVCVRSGWSVKVSGLTNGLILVSQVFANTLAGCHGNYTISSHSELRGCLRILSFITMKGTCWHAWFQWYAQQTNEIGMTAKCANHGANVECKNKYMLFFAITSTYMGSCHMI